MNFERLTGSELDLALNSNDTSVLYTSTRRSQAVNDGQAEFAALTNCYVRRASITVSCNTAEYVVSTISDFARISEWGLAEYHHTSTAGVFTQLAGPEFVRRDELWRNTYDGGWRQSTTPVTFPTGYYLRPDGGRWIVGLAERPDVGSSETVILRVPYVARPEPMTSTGDVPYTDTSGTRSDLTEYHQALVHYAAYKLLPLIGDREGAAAQYQLFTGYVARYQANNRPPDGAPISLARSYFAQARSRSGVDLSLERDPKWRWR